LPGEAKGRTEHIGNLATYVAEPTTGEVRQDVTVIYACDAFGLGIINNKFIPDRLADALACMVYVPDLLEGWFDLIFSFLMYETSLADTSLLGDYPALDMHIIDQPISHKYLFHQAIQYLKLVWSFLYKVGPRWMIKHSRSKVQLLAEGQHLVSLARR
jgi:hypothetical protein